MKELSLHILDIAENSLAAGATRIDIYIDEDMKGDELTIRIEDNGSGMEDEVASMASDPFFTTRKTRRVGMGLSLLSAAAERCGGRMVIKSRKGKGTSVFVTFRHSHIDRAPLGDIGASIAALIIGDTRGRPVVTYVHRREGRSFKFSTDMIRERLTDLPFNLPQVGTWVRNFVNQGVSGLGNTEIPL